MFLFDNSFVRDLKGLYEACRADTVPNPQWVVFNHALAEELGLDAKALYSPEGLNILVGNVLPDNAASVAQAYAGHQFGHYSPRLGDGRALLLGEILTPQNERRDLHFKGSGRTPFSRGGDGKAALGPMLREYLMGEAMRNLGIPTTQALAVVSTGEEVWRDTALPGAVLVRVAQSHLRVGTFQYAAATGNVDLVRQLANYALQRHYPHTQEAPNRYLAFYEAVVEAQAHLVSQWMSVGFIHGVMNTDNMSISGETIDYGPCAFMEGFHPDTVFSSIDTQGRYAYGAQPSIAQWNLARLGETLLPLFDSQENVAVDRAMEVLQSFRSRFQKHFLRKMSLKLGLEDNHPQGEPFINDVLKILSTHRIDFTTFFRRLSFALEGELEFPFAQFEDLRQWHKAWQHDRRASGQNLVQLASKMDAHNPLYIPRNHRVEEALSQAVKGNLEPFHQLLKVLKTPFQEQPRQEMYATPAPEDFGPYQTFCGT